MTRNITSFAAFFALVGLTLVTWWLADSGASAWLLAGVAAVKIAIIGAVFLELVRAWPVWSLISAAVVAAVLVGAAGLVGIAAG